LTSWIVHMVDSCAVLSRRNVRTIASIATANALLTIGAGRAKALPDPIVLSRR